MKRTIEVKVLPGEPTDGTGKVCIHLVVPDTIGLFVRRHMLDVQEGEDEHGNRTRQLVNRPTRCRLACDPNRTTRPVTKNGITVVTMSTDDPRAATCLKCLASDDYSKMMEMYRSIGEGKRVKLTGARK